MNKIERSEAACGGGEKTGEKGKEKKKKKIKKRERPPNLLEGLDSQTQNPQTIAFGGRH